jgi:predicted phage tail protein
MIKVYLAGILGAEYGRKHEFNVNNTRDIIDALSANYTNFKSRLMELARQGYVYTVQHGAKLLGKDELSNILKDFVVITPRLALRSGLVQTIIGAILITVGILLIETPFGPYLIAAGIAMIVGGVLALIAPGMKMPKLDDQESVESATSSFYAGGDFRLVSGSPMPFGYGTMLVSGSTISTITTTVVA